MFKSAVWTWQMLFHGDKIKNLWEVGGFDRSGEVLFYTKTHSSSEKMVYKVKDMQLSE
jgi:hypothetical protein